jgi:hypothetical protein
MKMKIINNVLKVIFCIFLIGANISYFIFKKEYLPIDQQLSLIFAVMTMFTIFSPVDASIIMKNIKELKESIKG